MPHFSSKFLLDEIDPDLVKTIQNTIFSSSHVACISFNSFGELSGINRGAFRLTGYSSASCLTHLSLSRVLAPYDLILQTLSHTINLDTEYTYDREICIELSCIKQDGTCIPVWANIELIRSRANGHAAHYIVVITPQVFAIEPMLSATHQSTSKLVSTSELAPCMIYQYRRHTDGTSAIPYASEAIRDIFRLAPSDVREDASRLLKLIHPDDIDNFFSLIYQSSLELLPRQDDFRLKFPNGDVRWIMATSSPHRETSGATIWHGVITDITYRKFSETARRHGDHQRLAILEAIPYLMFELDLAGYCHYLHGSSPDFAESVSGSHRAGQLVFEFLPFYAAQIVMAALQEANIYGYSSGKKFTLTLVQGELWFDLSISRKTNQLGELPRFLVICQDVTDITSSIRKLQISEDALKAVSCGVYISGQDGSILSVNQALLDITGYLEVELIGKKCNFAHGVDTDLSKIEEIRLAQLERVEFNGEVLNYRKDGSSFWNEMSITPITSERGLNFIGITHDITVRKLREASDAAIIAAINFPPGSADWSVN